MLEFALGMFVGSLVVVGSNRLYSKYLVWRHKRNWKNAGKQWKYIVDYSTRAIVLETAEEERARIEHARRFLYSRDLSSEPNKVDEDLIKTLEYLQNEDNPNRLSDISELQEHKDRMVEVEKNAEEFHKRTTLA